MNNWKLQIPNMHNVNWVCLRFYTPQVNVKWSDKVDLKQHFGARGFRHIPKMGDVNYEMTHSYKTIIFANSLQLFVSFFFLREFRLFAFVGFQIKSWNIIILNNVSRFDYTGILNMFRIWMVEVWSVFQWLTKWRPFFQWSGPSENPNFE